MKNMNSMVIFHNSWEINGNPIQWRYVLYLILAILWGDSLKF